MSNETRLADRDQRLMAAITDGLLLIVSVAAGLAIASQFMELDLADPDAVVRLQIAAPILQKVFQRLLDAGSFASNQVIKAGFAGGLVFHPNDWAVQGTILYSGEAIRQRGINFDDSGRSAVFAAVSHEDDLNIDLEVIDARTNQTFSDYEPDSNPIVIVDAPDPNTTYDLRVIYPKVEGAPGTLATALILVVGDS